MTKHDALRKQRIVEYIAATVREHGYPRYAEHKAEVETFLDSYESNHPDIEVVRIRPCVVVGPNSVDLFRGPLPTPLVGIFLSRLLPTPVPDPGIAVTPILPA